MLPSRCGGLLEVWSGRFDVFPVCSGCCISGDLIRECDALGLRFGVAAVLLFFVACPAQPESCLSGFHKHSATGNRPEIH